MIDQAGRGQFSRLEFELGLNGNDKWKFKFLD